ncbi:MAG: endonuclease MutS2, partial [Bacteroidales bacterium]|nr:endonuclease MutS2 [Bacteroidales bacterium]
MIYPDIFENKAGFNRIRELLKDYCTGHTGKELVDSMVFSSSFEEVSEKLEHVGEMQHLISASDPFFVDNNWDIRAALNKIRVPGAYTTEEELYNLKRHLEALRTVLNYFRSASVDICPRLKKIASEVKYYPAVSDSIDRILDKNGLVKDSASKRLREIRSEISSLSAEVTKKMQAVLRNARSEGIVDPDSTISIRNGRSVIPVNVYNKRKISGLVHDQSASGKTVFIEPAAVVELNNDILELEYEEKREIVKILIEISDTLRPYIDDMIASSQFLGEMDFVRAKAALGVRLGSIRPLLHDKPHLK